MFRNLTLFVAAIFSLLSASAHAEVTATFYSHDFGDHFPPYLRYGSFQQCGQNGLAD